jgi:hypothetical protein
MECDENEVHVDMSMIWSGDKLALARLPHAGVFKVAMFFSLACGGIFFQETRPFSIRELIMVTAGSKRSHPVTVFGT